MPWTLDLTGGRFAFESVAPHADCWGTVTTAGEYLTGGAVVRLQQVTDPATGRQMWSEAISLTGSPYEDRLHPVAQTRNTDGTICYRFPVRECGVYAAFIYDASGYPQNIRCVGFRFALASDGHPIVEPVDDVNAFDVLTVGPNVLRSVEANERAQREAAQARCRYTFEPDRPQE